MRASGLAFSLTPQGREPQAPLSLVHPLRVFRFRAKGEWGSDRWGLRVGG